MRAGPLGMLFSEQEQDLIHAAVAQSWCTHSSTHAYACAVLVANAPLQAYRSRGEELEVETFCHKLAVKVRQVDEDLARHVDSFAPTVALMSSGQGFTQAKVPAPAHISKYYHHSCPAC